MILKVLGLLVTSLLTPTTSVEEKKCAIILDVQTTSPNPRPASYVSGLEHTMLKSLTFSTTTQDLLDYRKLRKMIQPAKNKKNALAREAILNKMAELNNNELTLKSKMSQSNPQEQKLLTSKINAIDSELKTLNALRILLLLQNHANQRDQIVMQQDVMNCYHRLLVLKLNQLNDE